MYRESKGHTNSAREIQVKTDGFFRTQCNQQVRKGASREHICALGSLCAYWLFHRALEAVHDV